MRQAGTQKQAAPQQRATRSNSKKENLSTQPTLPNTRSSFKVGDLVSVQYRGRWYPAEVRGRVESSGYNIRYADKAEEDNVAASRITIRESTATSRDATVASERCQEFEHRLGVALRPGDKISAMHPASDRYDKVEVVDIDANAGKVTIKPWLGQTRSKSWWHADERGYLTVPFWDVKAIVETAEKERERQQKQHLKDIGLYCALKGAAEDSIVGLGSSSASSRARKRRSTATVKRDGEESHEDALDAAQETCGSTKKCKAEKPENSPGSNARASSGDTSLVPFSLWPKNVGGVELLEGHFEDSMKDYTAGVGLMLTIFVRSDAGRLHNIRNLSWALVEPHLAISQKHSVRIISIVKGAEADVKRYNDGIVGFFEGNDRVEISIVDMSEALLKQQFQTIEYGLAGASSITDCGSGGGLSILVRLDCFWIRRLSEFGCSLSHPSLLFQEPWGSSRDEAEGGHHAVYSDIFYSWPTSTFRAFQAAVQEVSSREAPPGEGQSRGQRHLGQWEMPRILMAKARRVHVAIPVSC
jgi:hypothetical protein